MKPTLYQALGIAPDATEAQISDAYQRCQATQAAGEYDRNAQIILKEAFAVLSNPTKRAHYDQSLKPARAPVAEPPQYESFRPAVDWRHGLAIALIAGVLSGWWFSRPKSAAPAATRVVAASEINAPQAMPVLMPSPIQETRPSDAPLALPASSGDLNSEELFARLAPSIVRINVSAESGQQVGIGSGVVIGPGRVITNCHVAQAGPGLQVRSGDANYEASLNLADQEHDLCRLDVPMLRAGGVSIGSARDLRTGQKVVAMGAPKGLDQTISEGIVSSLRQVDDGTLIQTTAPVSPGSSGGGLFDMHGRLVGIVTFQMTSGQNLNFAAPADWIEKMRSTNGNGIIGKLTARRDPGKDDSPAGHLPGSWSCHDTIRGSAFDIEFDTNGMVEVRKGKLVQQGRWRLTGRRIEIMGQNGPAFSVDHVSQEKLILNFEEGWRATCERG